MRLLGFVPALVSAENAAIDERNGRIKSIRLITTAATAAARIGEPTPLSAASYGTRYVRRERLETGDVVFAFLPPQHVVAFLRQN